MSVIRIAPFLLYTYFAAVLANNGRKDCWTLFKKVKELERKLSSCQISDRWINVAYEKKVTQSSTYAIYSPSNAVNGNLKDMIHTAWPHMEHSPWLRIDFGNIYKIHEIEIFNRHDGYGYKLHDFDVKLGNNLNKMFKVGHYTGPSRKGERIMFSPPYNTKARYIQIQIVRGVKDVLHVAEVVVWGSHV